jgi:hypothetical protein
MVPCINNLINFYIFWVVCYIGKNWLSNDYVSCICGTITYHFQYLRSGHTTILFIRAFVSSSGSCVWCPSIRQLLSYIFYPVRWRNWATHPNDLHRNVCEQSNTLHNDNFGPTHSLSLVALYFYPLKLLAVRWNYWTVKGKLILREIFVLTCVCFLLF